MKEKKVFNAKKSFFIFLSVIISFVVVVCGFNILIDPYYHYHKPLWNRGYYLDTSMERYINDGILKHYEYDALIIGNSMAQNFKTSEFDEIFGVNSVKTGFAGASFKEIDQNIQVALKYNKKLKTIIRSIDDNKFLDDKDMMNYGTYPTYLYDNNIFNDVKYVLSKDILKKSLSLVYHSVFAKDREINFDVYGRWNDGYTFGKESVLKTYKRSTKSSVTYDLTAEDVETVKGTINQNVIQTAKQNPDVTFYLFITPYSIIYWDSLNQEGIMNKHIQAQKIAIELMLECTNIKLYSFCENIDITANLDNYKDVGHYGAEINSLMLKYMKNGEYLLTKDNYNEYIENITQIYTNYDYDAIFD